VRRGGRREVAVGAEPRAGEATALRTNFVLLFILFRSRDSLSRVLPSTDLKIVRVIPLFVSLKDEVEEMVIALLTQLVLVIHNGQQ
jgi:hypothetical protein